MKYKFYGLTNQQKEDIQQIQQHLERFLDFDSIKYQNLFYTFNLIQPSNFTSLQIYIKLYSQHYFIKVQVYSTDTIKMLKQRLSQYFQVSIQHQIIVFNGSRIDQKQHSTFQQNYIKSNDKLYVADKSANYNQTQLKIKISKSCTNMISQILIPIKATIEDLYIAIQKITGIENMFFKLCYMGKFLVQKNRLVQQEYILNKAQILFTISHRKLQVTRQISEIFEYLALNQLCQNQITRFIINYDNEILQQNRIIENKINQHLNKLHLLFLDLNRHTLNVILQDIYQQNIEIYRKKYLSIIKQALNQFNINGLTKQIHSQQITYLLSLILNFSNIQISDNKFITFQIFFLDYVAFNFHRRTYFFYILNKLSIHKTATLQQKYQILKKSIWDLVNKGNFLHLQKFYGLKLEFLKDKIKKLIKILFPNSNNFSIQNYITLIIKNSVSFNSDELDLFVQMVDQLFFINMNALQKFTQNYEEDIALSLLLYIFALYYPLYQYKSKKNVDQNSIRVIKQGIRQNLIQIQNAQFLNQLKVLLFENQNKTFQYDNYI